MVARVLALALSLGWCSGMYQDYFIQGTSQSSCYTSGGGSTPGSCPSSSIWGVAHSCINNAGSQYDLCHTGDQVNNEWMSLDLGAPKSILSVVIVPRGGRFANVINFVLETSNNEFNWTPCGPEQVLSKDATLTVSCATTAQYVRFRNVKAGTNIVLKHLAVWPPTPAPTPAAMQSNKWCNNDKTLVLGMVNPV